jgi:carbonic anhydrase
MEKGLEVKNMKSRKLMLGVIYVLLILAVFSLNALASGKGIGISGEEALKRLMDGNTRFVEGKPIQKDLSNNRRTELTKGQQPFAVIISCSDSRVPPEHVFDQGLGDLFVVRVAGNIVDPIELGSVEYAVEHLGVPLVLVLGHQSCGAVKATVDGGKPEGNIGALVKKISPSVKQAKAKVKDKDKLLDAAILENAKNTASTLVKKSDLIKHLVESQKVKITAGVYSLATGKVDLIDLGTGKEKK